MTTQPPKECPHCGADVYEPYKSPMNAYWRFKCGTTLGKPHPLNEKPTPDLSDGCKHAAQLRKERDDLERENNLAHIALHETLEDDSGLTLERGIRQLGKERDEAMEKHETYRKEGGDILVKRLEGIQELKSTIKELEQALNWQTRVACNLQDQRDTLTQLLREVSHPVFVNYYAHQAIKDCKCTTCDLAARIEQAIKESEGR